MIPKLFSKLREDAYSNNCTIEVQYTAGSFLDPKGLEGLAHLTEHLLLDSSTVSELKMQGVTLNAFTYKRLLYIRLSGPFAPQYDYGITKALDVINSYIYSPLLRLEENALLKEKEIINQEIVRENQDTKKTEYYRIVDFITEKDNIKRGSVLGNESTLNRIQLEDVKDFFVKNIASSLPVLKLYYEGNLKDFVELKRTIESLLKDVQGKTEGTSYPYERLDLIKKDEFNFLLGSNKPSLSKRYISIYPHKIPPLLWRKSDN